MANIGTLTAYLGIDSSGLKKGEKEAKQSFNNIERLAKRTAGAIAGIFATVTLVDYTKQLIETADTMKLLDGRLKLVTNSQEQFTQAQEELFGIANKTRTSFESTLTLYTRMARTAGETGESQENMLAVTEAINKAVTVSGATTVEATNAMIQFSQGLGEGTLRGEEMNSVLSQIPRVAQLIADGLGVSTTALRKMGSEGELTPKKIIKAIMSQRDVIDREFAQMPKTVGQAMTVATNHLMRFIGEFDKASGMTDAIVDGIEDITASIASLDSGDIEKIADAMALIGSTATKTIKVVAAYYALFSGPAVIAGIGNWIKSMYAAAQATMQVNAAVAAGDAVMLNSAKATAMKTAAEAEAAAMAVKGAQAQVARTETDIAAVQAKIALINAEKNQIMTLIQEASVTADVTVLENKFAIASRQAAAAQLDLSNATKANTAAQAALSGAMAKSTASTQAAAAAGKKAKASLISLNNAATALFVGFVAWEFGKWVTDNFEWARVAGIHFMDDTIKGWLQIEKTAQLVFAYLKSGWVDWINDARSAYADFLEFSAKGVAKLDKTAAAGMLKSVEDLRKKVEKETTFEEAKIKINVEFDQKNAERAKRVAEMLRDTTDAARKGREKDLEEIAKRNKKIKEAEEATKAYKQAQDSLMEALLPLQTAHKEYQQNLAMLEDWYSKNKDKTVEYQTALDNLKKAYTETVESIQSAKIEEATAPMFQSMMDKIALERQALEMAAEKMEISEPEAIQGKIALLEREIEVRQRILQTIIGNSAAAQMARQQELVSIEELKLKIQELNDQLSDNTWAEGARQAFAEYARAANDAAAQSKQFFLNTFNTVENALVDFAETGTLEFEEMAKSILRDLMRIYIRALMVKAIMAFTGGGGGGGAGSAIAEAAGMVAHDGLDPSYKPPKFHSGMNPSYQPPRFHDGLKPDEFPAILQTGERVTSRAEVKKQNQQMAEYERWKMGGGADDAAGGGVNISVPIALDPSYSKRFRATMQEGIEATVLDVVRRFS